MLLRNEIKDEMAGRVARMREIRNAFKIFVGELEGNTTL
jgi:hypothetical protein